MFAVIINSVFPTSVIRMRLRSAEYWEYSRWKSNYCFIGKKNSKTLVEVFCFVLGRKTDFYSLIKHLLVMNWLEFSINSWNPVAWCVYIIFFSPIVRQHMDTVKLQCYKLTWKKNRWSYVCLAWMENQFCYTDYSFLNAVANGWNWRKC